MTAEEAIWHLARKEPEALRAIMAKLDEITRGAISPGHEEHEHSYRLGGVDAFVALMRVDLGVANRRRVQVVS